jgi:hypothetical protein
MLARCLQNQGVLRLRLIPSGWTLIQSAISNSRTAALSFGARDNSIIQFAYGRRHKKRKCGAALRNIVSRCNVRRIGIARRRGAPTVKEQISGLDQLSRGHAWSRIQQTERACPVAEPRPGVPPADFARIAFAARRRSNARTEGGGTQPRWRSGNGWP